MFSFTNEVNEEKSYHLVFEFFSAGKYVLQLGKFNCSIILVSSKYEILHVLRTFRPIVPPGADPAAFQVYEVGARYTSLEAQSSEIRSNDKESIGNDTEGEYFS